MHVVIKQKIEQQQFSILSETHDTVLTDNFYFCTDKDKYDDMLIGVKSTALKFGDNTKVWLTGFGTAMVSLLVLTGKMCDQTWPYYTAVSLTAAHIAHQVSTKST